MDEAQIKNLIEQTIRNGLSGNLFTLQKVTDTPKDSISVVNRKYVNLNGTVATRPNSSIATVGQRYFATDTNIPMTFNGTNWVNGVGSVVAIN